jgi:hypothetical protein
MGPEYHQNRPHWGRRMQSLVSILCCIAFAGTAWASQGAAPPPDSLVHVRTLTIVASDLSNVELLGTARALEGGTYSVKEVRERVLHDLKDLGYLRATAQEPHLTGIVLEKPRSTFADVSIHVSPGTRYRIGAIIFQGEHSFSAEQLRDAFGLPVGGDFNGTAIGKGLDQLRRLYGTDGHINFTAVPTLRIAEDGGTVELTLNIEEGERFYFGRLSFAGKETRAGEEKALLSAWTALSGKPYNGPLLSKWLVEHANFRANNWQDPLRNLELHQSSDTHRADILIKFPLDRQIERLLQMPWCCSYLR